MIIGVGIDVVDVARFMATLERTPRLREKLFTAEERDLPASSLAARFAAKEAIAKALGAPGNMHWHDATVHRVVGGPPSRTATAARRRLHRRLRPGSAKESSAAPAKQPGAPSR